MNSEHRRGPRKYPARTSRYQRTLRFASLLFALLTIPAASQDSPTEAAPPEGSFTVMTFNTGTGARVNGSADLNLGFGPEQSRISDEHYGNGLAWKAAVEGVAELIRHESPDIVAFQEMFHTGECVDIPIEARAGFVCEELQPGGPTVAQLVLGDDYQIATHPGHNDKVLAVHRRFGRILGCDADYCEGGLEGSKVDGCGGGARLARARIERTNGEVLTVFSYHGTSGMSPDDADCRVSQVEQIFVNFGNDAPGADGSAHLILGDFNTDPVRLAAVDRSAQRWNDFVGGNRPFRFHTGDPAHEPTYHIFTIDHIVSDVFSATVSFPGRSASAPEIFRAQMFDHTPVVARMHR